MFSTLRALTLSKMKPESQGALSLLLRLLGIELAHVVKEKARPIQKKGFEKNCRIAGGETAWN